MDQDSVRESEKKSTVKDLKRKRAERTDGTKVGKREKKICSEG